MRLTLTASVFALAVLVVACGGGKSGMLPSSPGQPSDPSGPTGAKSSRLAVTLEIPQASKQPNARKPFLLSPSTESIVFAVVNESQTPTPAEEQLFPIATPSPCAIAPTGSESCTFNVQAPFGTDIFYIATFSVGTPTLSSIPLASFTSSPIVIASPGAGSSTLAPITFDLNGVVAMVKLVVASPDPTTSNNKIFTVGTSTTPQPLSITPEDASGNPILATAFDAPITINVSPAPAGVGLVFTPTCSTSTTSARRATKRRDFPVTYGTITIGCPADLANVSYVYDGTVGFDSSQRITDTFTISATQLVSPAPSPATISLASTVQTTLVSTNANPGYSYSPFAMQTLANGTFLFTYEYNIESWIGTFDPSTNTVTPPVTFNGGPSNLNGPSSMAVANGTLWVAGGPPGASGLYCYSSLTSAMSGLPPVLSDVIPTIPQASGDPLSVEGIATDVSGNLWFVGNDSQVGSPPVYAGLINTSSGCVASSPTTSVHLSGAVNDTDVYVAALAGGGIAVQNAGYLAYSPNSVYVIKNTSTATVSPVAAVLSSANAGGLATDGAGNIFAAYYNTTNGDADVETMSQTASALNVLAPLPPSVTASLPSPQPIEVAAFSPSGGAADRLAYVDENYNGLGLIEGVPASPMPLLVNLPNQYHTVEATYAADGTEYVLYADASTNLYMARILATRTWSVPTVQITNYCNNSNQVALVGILERGDSGPFTFTSSGSVVATALPGIDHDYLLSTLPSSSGSFNVTVSDSHGRTETVPIISTENSITCGITRRHPGPPH